MTTKGIDVLVYVNTGTVESPVWTKVAGQRNATLTESRSTIDSTTKDDGGNSKNEPGLFSWSVSCDGLYVSGDTGQVALKTAHRAGTAVMLRWKEGGSYTEQGTATITSIERTSSQEEETTFKAEFQGSGAISTPVDATGLSGLTVTGIDGSLMPTFATGTKEYVADVLTGTASVTVTPTAAAGTIKVNGTTVASGAESGAIALGEAGSVTTITIVCAETDKTSVTYTVRIARP